jgi:aminopeptidase
MAKVGQTKELNMNDPRHQKLAQVLVHYSLKIKSGDKLAIWAPILAAPLARAVYREALHAGAHPAVRLTLGNNPGSFAFDGLTELKLSEGSLDQLRFIDLDLHEIEYYDALLYIWADENTKALSGIDPERMAAHQ